MTGFVLAATDFSEDARHAAHRAAIIARDRGVEIEIVHVLSDRLVDAVKRLLGIPVDIDRRLVSQAETQLNEVVDEIAGGSGVRAVGRVAVGDVVEEITAAGEGAGLMVLGAHGSAVPSSLLLGSIAERVLKRSRRPVLIVRRPPQTGYRRVLVPVAYGPYSLNALRSVQALAPEAEVTVLHAFAVPYEATLQLAGLRQDEIDAYAEGAHNEALARLNGLIGEMGAAGGRFRRRVEHGDAARLILSRAERDDSDLIVMGRQGDSALREVLLGSVTRHILSESRSDVLVVGPEPVDLPIAAA